MARISKYDREVMARKVVMHHFNDRALATIQVASLNKEFGLPPVEMAAA